MSNKPEEQTIRFVPKKSESVKFDPTSIGLPRNWSLTDWSDLKG